VIDQLHEVLQEIEHAWAGKRLLVVGDVMVDRYIWGEVARISPEAPVPIVRTTHQGQQPGGAGNVAMNLACLGAQTVLAGFTGGDEDERLLVENLRSKGITPVFVSCAGFPTITKTRILGGQQQLLRLDSERLADHSPADYDRLIESVLSQLPGCHAVILSDYAKGVLTHEVCQAIIQAARELGVPVLVDPKNPYFARYRGATIICPNLSELAAAARMPAGIGTHNLEALLDAAQAMVPAFDLTFIVATLSEKGIALLRPGLCFIDPAVARQVFDVSGAGDTVIAVLALCLSSNLQPQAAVQLANVAAGIVVGKVGTVPVQKHELLAALTPEFTLHAEDKVVTPEELVSRVAQWKANGQRVVFTNGCFDLLHIGHITLLEQARRLGDKLIVAINGDASVAALKGPGRPIVGERERARVLAALAAVDAVVVFPEPTPIGLIVAARPDVIVKGGDYNPEAVLGAREVQSWGGQVRIVPLVEGSSTAALIEKGARR
jgi:D-beta-D-heptose 7-phosphate kinase/D-beta-D-heptose 1-phosphate adenosyltransferase